MRGSTYLGSGLVDDPVTDQLLLNWTALAGKPQELGRVRAVISAYGDPLWLAFYGQGSGMPMIMVENATVTVDLGVIEPTNDVIGQVIYGLTGKVSASFIWESEP